MLTSVIGSNRIIPLATWAVMATGLKWARIGLWARDGPSRPPPCSSVSILARLMVTGTAKDRPIRETRLHIGAAALMRISLHQMCGVTPAHLMLSRSTVAVLYSREKAS